MKKMKMSHPDMKHMKSFEGEHVGTHDDHVHGKEAGVVKHASNLGAIKGEKSCSLDEKHYAHIK